MKYSGLILLLFLVGCAPKIIEEHHFIFSQGERVEFDSGTTASTVPNTYTVTNIAYFDIAADVFTERNTDQEGTNDADLSLAQKGAAAAVGSLLEDIRPTQDNRKKDSDNPVTTTTQTENAVPVPAPVDEPTRHDSEDAKTTPPIAEKHRYFRTYDLKSDHGKMFTWLDLTGARYGKDVKFMWPGCNDFIVPDAAVTTTRDGTSNQNQAYYFCGTDPEHQHGMAGRASIYSDPSCTSSTVTMYYNDATTPDAAQKNRQKETIAMVASNGRSFGKFERSGSFYGNGAILTTAKNDCWPMTIIDGAVSQGFYSDTNPNQNYYFSGADKQVLNGFNSVGQAAFLTRIGCVAKTATIEYEVN